MELRTILAGVDFSENSESALGYGLRLATRFSSRLVVFHALDPLLATTAAIHAFDLERQTRDELQEIVNRAQAAAGSAVSAKPMVVRGDAATEISALARRQRVDLIVIGTHGLSGYRKAFFGSTAEKVLRQATRPVLTIPPSAPPPPSGNRPFADGPVLIAVDFSEGSEFAVHEGLALAARLNLPVVLAHVVEPPALPQRWLGHVAAPHDEQVSRARRELEHLAAAARSSSATIATTVVEGRAPQALVDLATEREVSLIVLGLIGATKRPRYRPGTTAYRTISLAQTPVLAVPAAKRQRDAKP